MNEKIKLSTRIKSALKSILLSLKEQRVIFAFSVISFIFATLHIYDCDVDFKDFWDDAFWNISLAFIMGCLFSIPAAFLTKSLKPAKKYLIQIATGFAASVLGFFAIKGFGNAVYGSLYYWGIFFAATLITVFVFFPKENQQTYFSNLVKHFLFSLLMASVLFGGVSLLILAFNQLIFNFDDFGDIYETCAAFCYYVFAINVFVYYLFDKRQEESSGKAFKIIFFNILLPIFFVLVGLLYIYLIKALVLRHFPKGQINWFVSFASGTYFLFYFILKEYEQKPVVKFFYKFGAFAFIPLVCVQIPAYIIRLNAYGFTGWRFSSLMFIVFCVIMFVLTFIKKGAYIKYSILVLAAIILFASVTPCNLINVAHKSQLSRMMKVLEKYQMFDAENNRLAAYNADEIDQKISEEDRDKLYSAYSYLSWPCKLKMPDWALDNEKKERNFEELFRFSAKKKAEDEIRGSYNTNGYGYVDVSAYKTMKEFYTNEYSWGYRDKIYYHDYEIELPRAEISYGGKTYNITEFLLSLGLKERGSDYIFYDLDKNTVLCINQYEYTWNKSKKLFKSYEIRGYIFTK